MRPSPLAFVFYALAVADVGVFAAEPRLQRVQFNNPGLVVDLGVGLWAWPLPMDYDRDGDWDLVVSCPDKPYNGTYFFENGQGVRAKGQGAGNGGAPLTLDPQPLALPIFKPGVRIADGSTSVQVSFVGGQPVVMTPAKVYADFREHQFAQPIALPLPAKIDPQYERYRANQWRLVDWEADGDLDVIIGIEIWDDYGWDDAWDENGNWKNGPLHGFVYLAENLAIETPTGRDRQEAPAALADNQPWPAFLGPRPVFAPAVKLTTTDGKPIDVFGMPSPSFDDFDGDGDLDLVCGEFLDGFTYFQNTGTRSQPAYDTGRDLGSYRVHDDPFGNGQERSGIRMDLQMITPTAVDWDDDGDPDLICGDEDGRVAIIECLSDLKRIPNRRDVLSAHFLTPVFAEPVYFQQEAADLKFGALAAPCSVDWDGDGDEDLICGNTAGYIGFIENLDGGNPPKWAAPRNLQQIVFQSAASIHGELRYAAGPTGSIQGPCEAKWGYTTLSAADWNGDGLKDVVVNSIWGNVSWHKRQTNGLLFAQDIQVDSSATPTKPAWVWWTPENNQLTTEWRTTPCTVDWNDDGHNDLVMLDHEGYLAFFKRSRAKGQELRDSDKALDPQPSALDPLPVLPGRRIFKITGPCEFDGKHQPMGEKRDGLLRLNAGWAGKSGRRKLHIVDWDGDGRRDLLVNSTNVNWLRNVRTDDEGFVWFQDEGPLDTRVLAGHDTAPTTVDWDKNGIPDLLVGAEDGRMYYKRNPRE